MADQNLPSGALTVIEGEYLAEHARQLPSPILEIGSFVGASASCILRGMMDAVSVVEPDDRILWCVDPWGLYADGAKQATFLANMRLAGMTKHVRCLQGRSHEISPLLLHHWFGFVFIDGRHAAWNVMHDAILGTQISHCIIFHDYRQGYPGVVSVVDWFRTYTDWEFSRGPERMARFVEPKFAELYGLREWLDQTSVHHDQFPVTRPRRDAVGL